MNPQHAPRGPVALLVAVLILATTTLIGATAAMAQEAESPSATVANETQDPEPVNPGGTMMPVELVRALVQPSVVYLETTYSARVYDTYFHEYRNSGEPFSFTVSCTGFVVNPDGYIVTSGHCVQVDRSVTDELKDLAAEWLARELGYGPGDPEWEALGWWAEEYFVPEASDGTRGDVDRDVQVWYGIAVSSIEIGNTLPARILQVRPYDEGDVALIKIAAEDLSGLELNPDSSVEVGTPVVTVGYAASVDAVTDATFDASFKEGSVSSRRTVGNGLIDVFETSAAMTEGMSGGPTVNLVGEVIGINSYGIESESQPFNFVIPASIVEEVLREAGVANEIGDVNAIYRDGIAAYASGDKHLATELFEEVLTLVPSHELAQEYSGKAAKLPEPTTTTTTEPPTTSTTAGDARASTTVEQSTSRGGLPLGTVALAGAAGLVLAGGAAIWRTQRRSRNGTPAVTNAAADPEDPANRLGELSAAGVVTDEELEALVALLERRPVG